MPVQNFVGRSPNKFQRQKTCKIWPDFGRLRSWAANIYKTYEDIRNRSSTWSIGITPALGETSPVNFGPVALDILMWNRTYLKRFFRKTIFRPLGGAAPQIFTRAREWPILTSAPPHWGRGPPYNFFSKGGSKIGLKCSKCTSITSAVVWE